MLSNFHTHTTFCDGKNTAEEVVLYAIDKGFNAIGFSGHGYTDFDTSYCIQNMNDYIRTLRDLKEKYKIKIQIYVGVEEDAFCLVNRNDFDYIIGSSHYYHINNNYYSVDSGYEPVKTFLSFTNGDSNKLAEIYYENFLNYLLKRKPDIVGHFDIVTKFDEIDEPIFSGKHGYKELAEKYILKALKEDMLFEVNTGAISRGYRTFPYPSLDLLYTIKKNEGRLILSSDSHSANTLDFYFEETKKILRDVGFKHLYTLYNNEFIKYNI